LFLFFSVKWLEYLGFNQKYQTILNWMLGFLHLHPINVEISLFDSNNWIYSPEPGAYKEDATLQLPLEATKTQQELKDNLKYILDRSYLGFFKGPLKMDERIVESGLKVLESNQQRQLKKQQLDKMEEKLDHLLNVMQSMDRT
jgi:hypothetical protein